VIGFTGHVNAADIGLVYMQQRYYDPVAGRFLSIDPVITDADTGTSFNRYAYANNSPYKYQDPDGRNAIAVGIVGGATILAVGAWKYATDPQARAVMNRAFDAWRNRSDPKRNDSADTPKSDGKKGEDKPRGEGKANQPKSDLPRDESGNYTPHPDAEGPHSTLGTREGSDGGTYTQGATFDGNGKFEGRTDVTDHGRPQNHTNPHFHPAKGPNSVGKAEPIRE
jgi:RHS repeat-associated protein